MHLQSYFYRQSCVVCELAKIAAKARRSSKIHEVGSVYKLRHLLQIFAHLLRETLSPFEPLWPKNTPKWFCLLGEAVIAYFHTTSSRNFEPLRAFVAKKINRKLPDEYNKMMLLFIPNTTT